MIAEPSADQSAEVSDRAPESPRADALSWRAASVCREHPTHWWFAGGHRETAVAKEICAGCTVAEPCLEFALSRPELLGVWAATTPVERATIRRTGIRPAPPTPPAVAAESRPTPAAAAASPVVSLVAGDAPASGECDPEIGRRAARRGPGRNEGRFDRDELLTPAEAAHKLGVTPNTVTRWSRAGKISAIQTMGGHRRFRRSDIERVLRDGGAEVTEPSAN